MKDFEPSIASLRLVVKIVATGKLTRAASQLHMSQSAASHALRVLEAQVGARLFVRERGGLKLSEAGQRSLPRIEAALGNLEAMRAELTLEPEVSPAEMFEHVYAVPTRQLNEQRAMVEAGEDE